MKVKGFKLIKNGQGGIEINGKTPIQVRGSRAVFTDGYKQTRRYPISQPISVAIARLIYPVLVTSQYWREEYAPLMKTDYSAPDRFNSALKDTIEMRRLCMLWDSTTIQQVQNDMGNICINATINHQYSLVKVTATITADADGDFAMHTLTDGILEDVIGMITDVMIDPSRMLSDPQDIRNAFTKLASDEQLENVDSLTDDDMREQVLQLYARKGYGVVIDEKVLSQYAESIMGDPEDEDAEDPGVDPDESLFPEDMGIPMADIKSTNTMDHSSFEETDSIL